MASSSYLIRGRAFAAAKNIISGGKTSGIPPTFVLTQRSPEDAASKIAIQKASVRDVFRKI
jgi:hypothetical protein